MSTPGDAGDAPAARSSSADPAARSTAADPTARSTAADPAARSTAADPAARVMTWDEARAWRQSVRGRLVFTNGVFDLLHPGHVDVLLGARRQGDALVVGLNSDASVRRLKGPERPVRSEAERSYVLAALAMVDAVVLFGEDTPLDLIRALRPDVLVKGGDYTVDTIVGAPDVTGWGGEVVVIPLTPGQSTTSIIQKLRAPGSRDR